MSTKTMKSGQKMSIGSAARKDWGLIVGGLAVALAGIVVAGFPGLALVTLALVAGVGLIVAGIMDFASYSRMKAMGFEASGWTIASGILDIIVGLVFLFQPLATSVVIPWLMGALVIGYGIFSAVMAYQLRGLGTGWGWAFAAGIIAILCGLSFFLVPEFFALFLAAFLIVRGASMMAYGFIAPKELGYLG